MENPARQVRQVRRKIQYVDSESDYDDDSVKDEDFNPKEVESSDSSDDSDTILELEHSKQSPVCSTTMDVRGKRPENDEDEAKLRSLYIYYAAELRRKYHKRRLDNLLESNELIRVPIYGDGDCCFTTVIYSLNSAYSEKQLQEEVCDHFHENKDHYFDFLSFEGQITPEKRQNAFDDAGKNENSRILAKYVWWPITACCGKPFQMLCIYIYTSNPQQPIKMIQSHIFQQVGFTIKLALTAITGENHYDAVSNKNKDAYVCVMHSTDVTKTGLDVVTVLSPKDKDPFECASTSPAQCCI